MLLVQDGDIRGSGLLFVREQEAAGTGQTRMDFAFFAVFRAQLLIWKLTYAFSFVVLGWSLKAARPSPGAG